MQAIRPLQSAGLTLSTIYSGNTRPEPSSLSHNVCNFPATDKTVLQGKDDHADTNVLYTAEHLMCRPEDLRIECDLVDYRGPNEGTPYNVQPHLALMEKGWIVSVGTERSFYDLILSPEEKCDGLIIRDIHPKIIAYDNFLILLLWCAHDRADFCNLSSDENNVALLKEEIQTRIGNVAMPSAFQSYFMDNFEMLADAYLGRDHLPGRGDNTKTDYRVEDHLFDKLQRYARAGKIITSLGDINNLDFAQGRKITIIDTSNVLDYGYIAPTNYGDSTPRIIFTEPGRKAAYYSFLYEEASAQELATIKKFLHLFRDDWRNSIGPSLFADWTDDLFNVVPLKCLTKELVIKLRDSFINVIENLRYRVLRDAERSLTDGAYLALVKKLDNTRVHAQVEHDFSNDGIILNELLAWQR